MSLIELAVLAMATWRISYLLVTEDGPLDIVRSLRKRLHAGEFGPATLDARRLSAAEVEEAMLAADKQGLLGSLLSCVYCTSVWVSILLVAAWLLAPWTLWVCLPLAVSAAAIFLHEALERMRAE